jgi:hypothetical protein
MIPEPTSGLRVYFTDPDNTHPFTGWGTIKTVHGPRFVTLDMDDHTEVGAYTSELSLNQPGHPSVTNSNQELSC